MVLEIITIPSFESWDHVESKHYQKWVLGFFKVPKRYKKKKQQQ